MCAQWLPLSSAATTDLHLGNSSVDCIAALVRGLTTLFLRLTSGPVFPFLWTEATRSRPHGLILATLDPELEVRGWAVPKGEVIKVWPVAGCPWPDPRGSGYSFQASWEQGQHGRFSRLHGLVPGRLQPWGQLPWSGQFVHGMCVCVRAHVHPCC